LDAWEDWQALLGVLVVGVVDRDLSAQWPVLRNRAAS